MLDSKFADRRASVIWLGSPCLSAMQESLLSHSCSACVPTVTLHSLPHMPAQVSSDQLASVRNVLLRLNPSAKYFETVNSAVPLEEVLCTRLFSLDKVRG